MLSCPNKLSDKHPLISLAGTNSLLLQLKPLFFTHISNFIYGKNTSRTKAHFLLIILYNKINKSSNFLKKIKFEVNSKNDCEKLNKKSSC